VARQHGVRKRASVATAAAAAGGRAGRHTLTAISHYLSLALGAINGAHGARSQSGATISNMARKTS